MANPIDPPAPGPSKERRSRDREPPPTVLVVDDSAVIRKILRRILQEHGLRVIEAANGSEALAYCVIDRPALVLLDNDMPVMDGLTTLKTMVEDPHLSSLPVLMLTARTAGTDVARALDLGAQDYLRKPCDPAELIARIRRALSLQSRHDALYRRAEELGEISSTDTLTGLGNRRHMAQRISSMTNALGKSAQITVLILDIDHFKLVNDNQGHLVGDAVLKDLGQRLRSVLSATDTLVRWGGEEFLVLIPGDAVDPANVGEQLRNAVSSEVFVVGEEGSLIITVSVGVANGHLDKLTDVLLAADEALLEAKRSGRNQVRVAG